MREPDDTRQPSKADQPSAEQALLAPDEGDDDSLILWMLSLSPTQRLEVAQGFVDSVRALRKGRPA